MRICLALLLILLLLSPFLILIREIGGWAFPLTREALLALRFTFLQSVLSVLFSLTLGFLGAQGLLSVKDRWNPRTYKLLEMSLLVPNVLPTLFVILASLQWIRPFPFGMVGVVFVHSIMNIGLVALMVVRLFEGKLGGMVELAWIEGATRWQLLRHGVFGYLKQDLGWIGLFLFAICFSSFAVPLMVGGMGATTLEVLIYQKIRVSGGWSEALGLSAFQVATLFSLSLLLMRQKSVRVERRSNLCLLSLPWGWLLALLPTLFVLLGPISEVRLGWSQLMRASTLLSQLPQSILGTVVVSMGVGLLTLVLLLVIAYSFSLSFLRRFLMGYAVPSSVLTGFALLLATLEWEVEPSVYFKMILGIVLITLPSLYRMNWGSLLEGLSRQIETARVLGASWWRLFLEILLPQVLLEASFLAGLSAFWASGDFALSSIVAGQDLTLGLVVQGLMGSYRLEMATVLIWVMLGCGLSTFFFFWGLGYVASRKYSS